MLVLLHGLTATEESIGIRRTWVAVEREFWGWKSTKMKRKLRNTQRKNKITKEEICEDYCFFCKDGGDVRICDYKDCLKVYHPQCVDKDDSFLKSKARWSCNRHFCFVCHKTAKFHCSCCPKAVCGRCIWNSELVHVKGREGFCNHCLKLAILIEDNLDVDSDGGRVDFKEINTFEYLFKYYWETIKEKQGLSAEQLHNAKHLLKSGKNYRCDFDPNEIDNTEESYSEFDEEGYSESDEESDYDDWKGREEHAPVGKKKRSKEKLCPMKRKAVGKKIEFIGWGSETLIKFLTSIGTDTSKELSQNEVTTIVTNYCKENNLFDPQKRKNVICDAMLQSLFRKKSISVHRIYILLNAHFADNLESTEDDETGNSSEDRDENFMVTCRKNKLISDELPQKKIVVPDVQKSRFASIIAENIKLVYLKRSLVEELLKQPDTFDKKVMGSFVRVKSDPNDPSQKNSHQLFQVKGIKKASRSDEMKTDIFFQFFDMPKDVPVCKLSDDDFSKEECANLHQRVKDGMIEKPTVLELEQKARCLHEDIMKHWIPRELSLLQKRIDQANEKGWRRELDLYTDKRLLLETPSERARLLNEVPDVIADIENTDDNPENCHDKGEDNLRGSSQSPSFGLAKGKLCNPKGGTYPAGITKFGSTLENSSRQDKQERVVPQSAIKGPSQIPSSGLGSGTLFHPKGRTIPAGVAIFGSTLEKSPRQDKQERDGSPESAIKGPSQTPGTGLGCGTLCYPKGRNDPADTEIFGSTLENSLSQGKQKHDRLSDSAIKVPSQTPSTSLANGMTLSYSNGGTDPAEVQAGVNGGKRRQYVQVEKKSSKACEQKPLDFSSQGQPIVTPIKPSEPEGVQHIVEKQSTSKVVEIRNTPKVVETRSTSKVVETRSTSKVVETRSASKVVETRSTSKVVENRSTPKVEVVELSDDDKAVKGKVTAPVFEDPGSTLWHCVSPHGEARGPFKMSLLKKWHDSSECKLKFKVWREGQSKEDAILLTDAIRQYYVDVLVC